MTDRLYYTDSLLASFDGTVVEAAPEGARTRVVLDRTAFYPTSGGQPFDTGRLGDRAVIDVTERNDAEVEHLVDGRLEPGATVAGRIDWPRRFDHMQQHTGQHVLSAAFERLSRVRTVSFHLGADSATIDLAREVSPDEIAGAEALACQVVWENRPVVVRFASAEEAAALPLRKEPSRTGRLRLVEVPDFDLSACGGTHVPETGRIGMIAVAGWERFKGGSRITFVCGGRALASHARMRDLLLAATRALSVGQGEVPGAIERLQAESREQARAARQREELLSGFRAAAWRESAETIGGHRGVLRVDVDASPAEMRTLASALVADGGLIAVIVGAGTPAPVVVARSADVEIDAGALLRQLTSALGGRGGGRPDMAQGGIPAEPEHILARVRTALADAR
jgi:alanyl-tRNA synthetase